MDRFDAMHLFVRVVERRSFTDAANDTGVPRSTVSEVIKQMEERLGVQLLQRTTRVVRPTLDGEAYYARCLRIISDMEDAESAFSSVAPKGQLRVEVQGTLARYFLIPDLPIFLAKYPDIDVSMTERDRWVDLVEEGVDCALRWGKLPDSDLIARKLCMAERLTCASPKYLAEYGTPMSIDDLDGHHVVGMRSLTTGELDPLEFVEKAVTQSCRRPARVSVTGPESYIESTRQGLGLAQMPRFHIAEDLKAGRLVSVLNEIPPPSVPISLIYPRSRQLSTRLRVFIDWMVLTAGKMGLSR